MAKYAPKKHHIQPQVLLRQFADAREKIAVVKKVGRTKKIRPVKNVSVIGNANTLRVRSGLDYSLENMFSKVESYYPSVIVSLDHTVRSPDEDAFIMALVTTQMARDPLNRSTVVGDEAASIYEALRRALLDEDPRITEDGVNEEYDFYARRYIIKSHVDTAPTNVAIAGMPWLVQAYYTRLQPNNVSILRAPAESFVTADRPLSICDSASYAGMDRETHDLIFDKTTEMVFPITSRHAALITQAALSPLIDVKSDMVAIINARTVRAADSEIYCHPSFPPDRLRTALSMWWWRRALQPDLR